MTQRVHVLFGTQTGTTEMVASDVEDSLVSKGITPASVRGLEDLSLKEFSELGTALLVCSTYGEGGMPDNAASFFEALCGNDAPDLSKLKYSVLAFGDSSYADFCAAGRHLDARLAELGGQRIYERVDCDIMYEDAAESWTEGVITAIQNAVDDPVSEAKAKDSAAVVLPSPEVVLLFGSQTGTSEMVASDVEDALVAAKMSPHQVAALDEIDPLDLQQMDCVLIVCSTYGEGGMPENAQLFYDAIVAADFPRLENMKFSVLALGDSSFPDFCAAGRKIDARLSALGATRVYDLAKCDIMFEATAETWTKAVIEVLLGPPEETGSKPSASAVAAALKREKQRWTRSNPYDAALIEAELLSGPGSAKEIWHYRLDLGEDGPRYEAGDALNVLPENDPALVSAWAEKVNLSAGEPLPGFDVSLEVALKKHLEIALPSHDLITYVSKRAGDEDLQRILNGGDRDALTAWLWNKDALDLISLIPEHKIDPVDVKHILRPIAHRSYSISSSALVSERKVDLTVSTVRYTSHGRSHGGAASTFLADRMKVGTKVKVFPAPNNAFRVPKDPTAPTIMVGPGTGIAPFRGFLQERKATGATGTNWLFFGDQTRASDFIYADDLKSFQDAGVLTRLDLAFSRDQVEKVYVQHLMKAASSDLFATLESGGHFYVCGDATRMAVDVDETLHAIVAQEGGMSEGGARDYVDDLRKSKRYVRDVY